MEWAKATKRTELFQLLETHINREETIGEMERALYSKQQLIECLEKRVHSLNKALMSICREDSFMLPKESAGAMFQAIRDGNSKLVKTLIEANIPLDLRDDEGKTFLHVAVECGELGLVIDLIQCEAAINSIVLGKEDAEQGCTALQYAACHNRANIAEILLIAGASPRIPDVNGYTPLHWAVSNINLPLVTLLMFPPNINHGARPDARDRNGRSPLSLALEKQNPNQDMREIINLLEQAMPQSVTPGLGCPLCCEIYNEHEHHPVVHRYCGHVICSACSTKNFSIDGAGEGARNLDEQGKPVHMDTCPTCRSGVENKDDWQKLYFFE